MVDTAAQIWRDYVTDAVPASGAKKPEKAKIREWGTFIEASLPIRPERYGAAADGTTDDKTAIEAAAAAAIASGGYLYFTPGKTYAFTTLSLPANLNIRSHGAILRDKGTNTGATVSVVFGDNTRADDVTITSPGTETNTDLFSFGDGFYANSFTVESDTQHAIGGGTCTGQDIRIGYFRSRKVDRPLHFYNQATGAGEQTTGSWIGYLDVENYVRAFRADYCYGFVIGRVRAYTRSPNAVEDTAGQNGILIQGCSFFEIGDIDCEGAPEHVLRVGGSPHANCISIGFTIGHIKARNSGGCPLKINPTRLASVGVTEKASGWSVAGITGYDCGNNANEGNQELVRLSHARNGYIGYAFAYIEDATQSAQYVIQANDCDDIEIGEVGGNAINSGFVIFDGTSDVDGVSYFGGDITDFRIGRLTGSCAGSNAIGVAMGSFNLSNVCIADMDITGFTTNLMLWVSGTLTGPFLVAGRVNGAVAPIISGAPASDLLQVDVLYNNTRSVGRGGSVRGGAALEVVVPAFNTGSAAPNGIMLNSSTSTAGSGNYGSAIEWSRLGGSRRAAAIATRQNSADDKEVDLTFWVGDSSSTANEGLLEAGRFSKERAFLIPDGITAPATTSGWATIYVDTADGDLKIKFGDGTVKTIVVDT